MNQVGFVRSVSKNMATLEVRRVSSCGEKCSSCGSSCNIPATRVDIKNTLNAKEGDFVEVKMKTKVILQSAFIVYVIPLIMMIIGISAGIGIFKAMGYNNYESLALLTGLVAILVSFLVLRIIDKKLKDSNKIEFEMIKIL